MLVIAEGETFSFTAFGVRLRRFGNSMTWPVGGDYALPLLEAGSVGRRNTCVQLNCWSLKAQGLSGPLIQA